MAKTKKRQRRVIGKPKPVTRTRLQLQEFRPALTESQSLTVYAPLADVLAAIEPILREKFGKEPGA